MPREEPRSCAHGAGCPVLLQPPDPHTGPKFAPVPSPFVLSTARRARRLLRPQPTILFPSDSPRTPRGQKGASSPLCMHSGSSWLPGSCGPTSNKSRDTPCKVGNGWDESSFQGGETSRKLRMECNAPCLQGVARPDPLSPVLVIKVMTVLLMPSLSRE